MSDEHEMARSLRAEVRDRIADPESETRVNFWNVRGGDITALPPDVRKRLCPSVSSVIQSVGAAPRGLAPTLLRSRAAGQSLRLTSGGKPVALSEF